MKNREHAGNIKKEIIRLYLNYNFFGYGERKIFNVLNAKGDEIAELYNQLDGTNQNELIKKLSNEEKDFLFSLHNITL